MPSVPAAARHWLLEATFILIAVGLAFAVDEYRENRANRELAARALAGIQAELEHNLAVLEPLYPIHQTWMAALNKADTSAANQSGLDLFFATRPPLPADAQSAFAVFRHSAWDAALSSGALRLIDYDVTAVLSDIYTSQELAASSLNRLTTFFSSVAAFEPASRVASVRLMWLTMADIESVEGALLGLYRKHLPAIRAAAAAAR